MTGTHDYVGDSVVQVVAHTGPMQLQVLSQRTHNAAVRPVLHRESRGGGAAACGWRSVSSAILIAASQLLRHVQILRLVVVAVVVAVVAITAIRSAYIYIYIYWSGLTSTMPSCQSAFHSLYRGSRSSAARCSAANSLHLRQHNM